MMTQPIQMFENLTSETTPAGGNVAKTGFNHADRQLLELRARYARSEMIADVVTDAILWVARQYKRGTAALKADFKLRAAEQQLFRMSDRELADLGLSRGDIPFAIRDAAVEGYTPAVVTKTAAPVVAANRNQSPTIFWAGRA